MRHLTFVRAALLLALLPAAAAHAQTVLLDADVAADTARQTFGPNRRFYRHLYGGYALVVGPDQPGAPLRYGASGELTLGLRHKLRLTSWLALGADVRYLRQTYALRQTAGKVLPTPVLHHRESFTLHRADAEAWLRLNAGRRGNAIGQYLDLGAWGGWVLGSAHHTEDRPGAGPARRVLGTERGLRYLERWPYGLAGRLGLGRYAAQARYRLSDSFRGAAYPELPRWALGLEVGLF
ncbi:hypothetical protein [Hymenobacter sp. B81]|uniref:hypothetical protein n=1 Tax=Hymenobacter sp. B81 TaxID=3344878 RepID=UPI0037DDB13E